MHVISLTYICVCSYAANLKHRDCQCLVAPRDTNGVDNISGPPRVSTIGPTTIINSAVTPRSHNTDLEHRILSEEGKTFGNDSTNLNIQ